MNEIVLKYIELLVTEFNCDKDKLIKYYKEDYYKLINLAKGDNVYKLDKLK